MPHGRVANGGISCSLAVELGDLLDGRVLVRWDANEVDSRHEIEGLPPHATSSSVPGWRSNAGHRGQQ